MLICWWNLIFPLDYDKNEFEVHGKMMIAQFFNFWVQNFSVYFRLFGPRNFIFHKDVLVFLFFGECDDVTFWYTQKKYDHIEISYIVTHHCRLGVVFHREYESECNSFKNQHYLLAILYRILCICQHFKIFWLQMIKEK